MAYCEAADLSLVVNTNRVTEAADDDKDGTADTGVIAYGIARADDQIYGIIRRRYNASTPASFATVGEVPNDLRYMAAQLAAVYVFRRQMRDPAGLRDEALAWAQSVRDGLTDLSAGSMTAVATGPQKGRARFNREKGYRNTQIGEPEEGDVDSTTDNTSFLTDD